ncbi:uncharacterized protein LOC142617962 [Castanea sativa]|uniref:uncharacterized protein LOC142617962 n=1 Tax=Castanea sativa TaxID=21020 RepID=UPI003F64EC59
MASLTPGVLSKLLQHAGNKDVKVTGEHRSALLQVIEIVPSLPNDHDNDPWKSKGFFLKVSDSLHSAYVSISDNDMDLIYSDKIQLGQFVYASRLDLGSPVPVLRGLKPVPKSKRSPCPCVGNPTDLVPSDLLPITPKRDFHNAKVVKTKKAKPKNVEVEGLQLRRLSLDSARRVWDQSPKATSTSTSRTNAAHTTTTTTTSSSKSKQVCNSSDNASVISDKKAFKNEKPTKPPSLSVSPLQNKNDIFSPKPRSKTSKKDSKSSSGGTIPIHLLNVPLNFKTWSDQRILWNALPSTINNLGKKAMSHRNVAFLAAVRELEEASAAESIINCMRTFAELCDTSQKVPAGTLVEQFLDLHLSMQRAGKVVNSLQSITLSEAKSNGYCSLQRSLPDACKRFTDKNATSWVQAAVGTNLSKFNLFRTQEKSSLQNGEKCYYVVIDKNPEELNSKSNSPQDKQSHRNHGSSLSESSAKRLPSPSQRHTTKKTNTVREDCSKGSRLKETATLAEKLLLVSREWFLKYLEDSLNVGFEQSREERSEIAYLLGQLKRVNQWLDDLVGGGVGVDERIDDLRKKLYGFLLEHVDSTIVSIN